MEEISLDPQILQRILRCFDESQNANANQYNIYMELESIIQSEPFFFCYFIQILIISLQEETNNLRYSQLSIISLRRFFKSIDNLQIAFFLNNIIPVLMSIISNNIYPLISHTALLMSNIVEIYGEEAITNFDNILYNLLLDTNTVSAGIDAMLDISEKTSNYQLKLEHLQELNRIFSEIPDSDLTATFLTIILNLLQNQMLKELYIEFISTEILKFINDNYSNFQNSSLLYSMCIVITFFEETGDSELGDFIVFCIQNLRDLTFEGLECFSDDIPFHPGLVASLFELLDQIDEEEEESENVVFIDEFNCSDIAESTLQKMSEKHRDQVVNIIIELISESQNPTQILKALCSISSELKEPENFIQFAIDHLNDESRGEASLFLSQIVDQDNVDQIISELIPISLDEDNRVRKKVLFSLDNIFKSELELQIEMSWIPPLLDAFIIVVSEEDSFFAISLSHEIYLILNQLENLNDELFQSFFSFVYELFFSDDKDSIFYIAAATLLEILLKKLDIQYSKEIEAIIGQMMNLLQNFEVTFHCRDSFCSLMLTMCEIYPENITPLLYDPLFLIAGISIQSDFTLQPLENFWKLNVKVFTLIPELLQGSDLFLACIELAKNQFNFDSFSLNFEYISEFLSLAFKSLDDETIDNFMNATFEIIESNEESLLEIKNVVALLKEILEYKEEKKSLLPEHVNFYNEVKEKMEKL